ncbi:hypothetical protein TSOC_011310, partial [Tetrabaena socialis]
MLFVDESAQSDGWEAFPTQQLTADSYAAELIRGHTKSVAAAAATAAAAAASPRGGAHPAAAAAATAQGAPGFSLGGMGFSGLGLGGLTGFGGGGNPNALEDLHDIMTTDPLTAAAARRRRSGSGGGGGGYDDDGDEWASSPSAPALLGHDAAGPSGSAGHRRQQAAAVVAVGGCGSVLTLEPPLWLPDSHASDCLSCHLPFRPFTRLRHHCRLCGKIFCSACCHKRALLPPKYGTSAQSSRPQRSVDGGQRTPERVCELCSAVLTPHQQLLAGTMAAAAQPPVQDSPDSISLRSWVNSPWTSALGQDVFKAANMLSTFVKAVHMQPEAGLPTACLQGAAGLALLTVARVGAGWSLSYGTGLVVGRNPSGGWSAPCAISAAGVGWGLQLGGELADVLLVLRSREALSGLCGGLGAGVVVGGSAALACGPVGRKADASLVLNATGTAAAYGYSCSKGAFVGLSVESTLLSVRSQINHDFYGYPVTPRQLLLEDAVPPPPAAAMLYEGIKVRHEMRYGGGSARTTHVQQRSTHAARH